MILLTTPDYIPKLGGLTTFAVNVENVLKDLGIEYELFHWKDYHEVINYPQDKLDQFDYIINIHSGFHQYMKKSKSPVINFILGAEILFYSPNLIKRLVKKIMKGKSLNRLASARFNIFISNFTLQTLINKGLEPDYSRDLIFHPMIETKINKCIIKNLNEDVLKFICVARDVPHKNFSGALKFCEDFQEISGKKVEFITITNRVFKSDKIKVTSIVNSNNQDRDKLFSESHFNLLFSLDHSYKGFFEGFGQTVQEAACFATPSVVLNAGGLPESVHDNETGWVLPSLDKVEIKKWWNLINEESYQRISKECYDHTLESHGLHNWKNLFKKLLNNE